MARRIIVQEDRPGAAAPPESRFDLQDYLLAGCLTGVLTGVAFLKWQVALILAGLFCGFFHYLIGVQKARKKNGPTNP